MRFTRKYGKSLLKSVSISCQFIEDQEVLQTVRDNTYNKENFLVFT